MTKRLRNMYVPARVDMGGIDRIILRSIIAIERSYTLLSRLDAVHASRESDADSADIESDCQV